MPQSKRQKKRLIEAKKMGLKHTGFNKVVKGCVQSDIEPRFGQTKQEACENIAGALKAKQIKRFGSEKVQSKGKTVIKVAR